MNRRAALLSLCAIAMAGTSCKPRPVPHDVVGFQVEHPGAKYSPVVQELLVEKGKRRGARVHVTALNGGANHYTRFELDGSKHGFFWVTVKESADNTHWEEQKIDFKASALPRTLTFKDGVKVHLTFSQTALAPPAKWWQVIPSR